MHKGSHGAGGKVLLANGAAIEYDWLVLALGSDTVYFGIEGVKEHCLPFCTYNDVLRVCLFSMFTHATCFLRLGSTRLDFIALQCSNMHQHASEVVKSLTMNWKFCDIRILICMPGGEAAAKAGAAARPVRGSSGGLRLCWRRACIHGGRASAGTCKAANDHSRSCSPFSPSCWRS
jgi:hypothetical protein